MPYFAYNVGGWVQKEGKMCLRNKSMAPTDTASVCRREMRIGIANDDRPLEPNPTVNTFFRYNLIEYFYLDPTLCEPRTIEILSMHA